MLCLSQLAALQQVRDLDFFSGRQPCNGLLGEVELPFLKGLKRCVQGHGWFIGDLAVLG